MAAANPDGENLVVMAIDSDTSSDSEGNSSEGESLTSGDLCTVLQSTLEESGYDLNIFKSHIEELCTVHDDLLTKIDEILIHSVSRGLVRLVKCLLDLYKDAINLDHRSTDIPGGDTFLTAAARGSYTDLITLLLNRGATISSATVSGETALDLVCAKGSTECVNILIDWLLGSGNGSEVVPPVCSRVTRNELLYYGMCAAAHNCHADVLKLFAEKGVDVNLNLDDELGTPLHRSSESGCIRCTDVLLEAGADFELLRHSVEQTPMMRAAEFGHLDIMKRLVACGAEVDRVTAECSSALTIACHYGHDDCVRYLLEHGADPKRRNPWGYTPLFMGADSPKIVQALLQHGVQVDELCGERGEAAIHLACVIGCADTVQVLLDRGSDINIQTYHQETPLWLAAWKGHMTVCRLLLQQNCELNVPSNGCQVYAFDYLPVEIAMGLCHFDIMKMILMAGCDMRNKLYYDVSRDGPLEDIPWVRLRPEPLQLQQVNKDVYSWFYDFVSTAQKLKHICRLVIRNILKTPLKKKTDMLPIPSQLKDYICFVDV